MTVAGEFTVQRTLSRVLSLFLKFLLWIVLALSLLTTALHFVSYARAKVLVDRFVAVHRISASVRNYFTEPHYNLISEHLLIVAGVFGICGLALVLFKQKLLNCFLEIQSECTPIHFSLRDQFHGDKETAVEIGVVFIVFVVGIVLRVRHLNRGVRYDEAWTYVEFASRPLIIGLSNYRAPNNHLLNTLLVHFSTRWFGNTIFGLRFPALAAGCLVILASWFVTRAVYGRLAGMLMAGFVAALPTFIEFSINARGYALQWLFFLVMLWFAALLRENSSLKIGWLGFILAAVAGIYAIPTTILIVAGVFLWLGLSALADHDATKLKSVTRQIAGATLAIVLLSTLLYIPPLLIRGPGALTASEFVGWQQNVFVQGFKDMCKCAWIEWSAGVPTSILWIIFAGFATGLLIHGRLCKYPVPTLIALCFPVAIFVCVRHVFGYPRIWSYLLLSALMTASAGLSLFSALLVGRSRFRQVILVGAVSIGLTMFVGAEIIHQRVLLTTNETGRIADADQIVEFLARNTRPGDSLVSNAIIEYELLQHRPDLYHSLAKPEEAAHVIAVVVKTTGNTEICRTEKLMALFAAQDVADLGALKAEIALDTYTTPQVLAKFLTSTVYSLNRKPGGTQRPSEDHPSSSLN